MVRLVAAHVCTIKDKQARHRVASTQLRKNHAKKLMDMHMCGQGHTAAIVPEMHKAANSKTMHAVLFARDRGMGNQPLFEACERNLTDSVAAVVTADTPTSQIPGHRRRQSLSPVWQHHLSSWLSHLTSFQVSRMS